MARWFWIGFVVVAVSMPAMASFWQENGWLEDDSQVHSLLQYPAEVEEVYRANHTQMIWFDLQQSSKLEFQLEVIQQAGFSSLFSRQLSYLSYYRKSNRWQEYDLLATDTLLLYLTYAETAKEKGDQWYFANGLDAGLNTPNKSSLIALKRAVLNNQLGELIEAYTPDSADYQYLLDTYLHLLKFQKREIPNYRQSGLKRVGDTLNHREVLLTRLEMVDVDLIDVRRDIRYYDETLENAVKQFQQLHGLKPDGVIGPNTITWLNLPLERRLSTLALNAERIRYWPVQRDTIIVVNVPSYEMTYWHSGDTIFESKVVVGKKARPTPLMITNLDTLILNPTWNIPWKIMIEDIIPKVKHDRDYLSRQNIKIIPKWGSKDYIDPNEIEWDSLVASSFPYRMTQLSGTTNALGLYKFNTPNRRAIYLHDTPSKGLFNQEQRAFSSGCVRVEHASVFASRLLERQGIEIESQDPLAPLSNKAIAFRKRIPVHIIYQTAWYEGGKVNYREDIYRLDRSPYGKG